MKDDMIVKIVAICGIVVLEVANILTKGPDGAIVGLVIGAIAGIAGYTIARKI